MKTRHHSNNRLNCEQLFSWLVFLLFFLATCLNSLIPVFRGDFLRINYRFWEVSEWLINYQGGFVRRGICGQLLWQLEQWFPFDVRIALVGICLISSSLMLWLIFRLFKKEGWALLIVPTGFCLGFTLFNLFGRRDFISLLLTFAIFMIFRNLATHPRKWGGWVAFYIVSALQLLIHEASFFYTFPILMFYSYQRRDGQLTPCKSIMRTLLQFLPVLAVMAAVCLFKGNERVAHVIWDSWAPVISRFQDDMRLGYGLIAMTWDVKWTFAGHFTTAFVGDVSPSAWRILLALFNLMSLYYLTTRLNAVDMGLYKPRPMNHVLMSDIVIVQFVALLPMFTVLSCDWGRTLPYWAISSVFFYHLFKDESISFMPSLSRTSSRIQTYISSNRILSSPYTYILLILVAPVPNYKAPLDHINTFQQKFFYILCDLFNQFASVIS